MASFTSSAAVTRASQAAPGCEEWLVFQVWTFRARKRIKLCYILASGALRQEDFVSVNPTSE